MSIFDRSFSHLFARGYRENNEVARQSYVCGPDDSEDSKSVVETTYPEYVNKMDTDIKHTEICAIDVETTGFNEKTDRITEIAAIKIKNNTVIGKIEFLVNPERPIPSKISTLTGITDQMVSGEPLFSERVDELLEFIGDTVIIAHHSRFDMKFINMELERSSHKPLKNSVLCSCNLAKKLYPHFNRYSLDAIAGRFDLKFVSRHRAYGDALMVTDIFKKFLRRLEQISIHSLQGVLKMSNGK